MVYFCVGFGSIGQDDLCVFNEEIYRPVPYFGAGGNLLLFFIDIGHHFPVYLRIQLRKL